MNTAVSLIGLAWKSHPLPVRRSKQAGIKKEGKQAASKQAASFLVTLCMQEVGRWKELSEGMHEGATLLSPSAIRFFGWVPVVYLLT